jgi:hypothetical protein
VLTVHNGPRTVDGFRTTVQGAAEFQKLVAKAEKGDAKASLEVFKRRVDQGTIDPAVARAKLDELDLPADERGTYEQKITDIELNKILSSSRDQTDAARKVAAMHEAGRIPTGAQAINYWFLLAKHGEQTGNPDLLATALAKFREGVGSNPRAQRQIEEFEKALEKLLDKQDADKGGKPDKK